MTRDRSTEEPCAAKVACTVLKTSGRGDPLAEFNRAIRPGVLWRTGSLETQSAQGSRFVVDQIRRPSRMSYFVVINLLTALAIKSGFNSAWVAVHVPRASLP